MAAPADAFPRLALTLAKLTERIPLGWAVRRQWVAWRLEKRDGRWTKVPIDPRSGKRASSTDPTTWGTLAEAFAWHATNPASRGVGLTFAEGSGLVGIDLDHCIDENGQLAPWASEILTNMPSYAEVSPSGKGVKLWALGPALPKGVRLADYPVKGSAVEMYSSGRYFTVTGNRLPDAPREVKGCANAVTALLALVEQARKKRTKATAHGPVGNEKVSGEATLKATSAGRSSGYIPDDEIIQRARDAKHGARFRALWAGDWKAAGYGSQSEADLSLCGTLAFWAGPDANQIDALFRRSGLMRPKWDEKHGTETYGAMTVATALDGRKDFYTPWGVESSGRSTSPLPCPTESTEGSKDAGRRVTSVTVQDLLGRKLPPREFLLKPLLRVKDLGMVYGSRGIGKTWGTLGMASGICTGQGFMKWTSPRPANVLFVDGEMQGEDLQFRLRVLIPADRRTSAQLRVITPDLQDAPLPNLATAEGQIRLEEHLPGVEVLFIDNLSALVNGGPENDAESWDRVQEWLLNLRRRGLTVILVHHAGRNGLARGTSRREDVLDTILSLRRPTDYKASDGARFEVHFEKSRGLFGADADPFEAKLIAEEGSPARWDLKDVSTAWHAKAIQLAREGLGPTEIGIKLRKDKGSVSRVLTKAREKGAL